MTITLITLAALLTAAPDKKEKPMTPKVFHTVEFQGGKAWQKDLPPEKQDLAGHFAQVKADFEKHELLGNGPLVETFHGFYVYQQADTANVKARAEQDQGVKKGVLELVEVKPWYVLIDNSSLDLKGRQLFVLEYSAGPAYSRGAAIEQQSPALVKAHMDYVGAKAGMVFLGGPVDPSVGRGRYIIAASSREEALGFLKEDPAISALLFNAELKTWAPFQHQASHH